MHRSRRVEVGIRADDPNLHTPYDGDRITTPWKRSKNTLVQDEWVYRTGALSPKSGRREHESRGGEKRAHTALGVQSSNSVGFGQDSHDSLVHVQHSQHSQHSLRMRSESAGSPSMEPEPWRQPVLKLPDSACGKYQTGRLVEGYTSRSATPLLWVQDRYFTKLKTQVNFPQFRSSRAHSTPLLSNEEKNLDNFLKYACACPRSRKVVLHLVGLVRRVVEILHHEIPQPFPRPSATKFGDCPATIRRSDGKKSQRTFCASMAMAYRSTKRLITKCLSQLHSPVT